MRSFLTQCRWGPFIAIEGDGISRYVAAYGEWSPAEVDLITTLTPEDGTVIEVGSNIGSHTALIARHLAHGIVLAFEPQRPIYYILAGNLALANCLNVIAKNMAVGDSCGEIEIETSDYSTPWNYGSFSLRNGFSDEAPFPGTTQKTKVAITTLDADPDAAALTRMDLLKIDAEGCELDVLKGGQGLIKRHQPFIFVEAARPQLTRDIAKWLGRRDYVGYWFIVTRARPESFRTPAPEVAPPPLHMDINIIYAPRAKADLLSVLPLVGDDDWPPRLTPVLQRYPHPPGAPFEYGFPSPRPE